MNELVLVEHERISGSRQMALQPVRTTYVGMNRYSVVAKRILTLDGVGCYTQDCGCL
jgi:hypothetical protein